MSFQYCVYSYFCTMAINCFVGFKAYFINLNNIFKRDDKYSQKYFNTANLIQTLYIATHCVLTSITAYLGQKNSFNFIPNFL